ncbi:MAG: acetylxylan esterase [Bacteroidales bacterium]
MSRRNLFLIIFFIAFSGFVALAQLSKPQRNYIDLIVTPDHADWIYRTGEKPTVKVMAFKSGIAQEGARVSYAAGPEMMDLTTTGEAIIQNGVANFTLPTLEKSGFLQCRITVKVGDAAYSDQIKLGFSPDKIEPTAVMPADFGMFWEKQIRDLETVPLDVTRRLNERYTTDKVLVYEVSYRAAKEGYRMNGWLMVPNKKGTFPAVVMPPGAGIKPQVPSCQLAETGVITLQLEVHGLPLGMDVEAYDGIRRAYGDYMFVNLDDREKYYYKRVYLGCKRGVDLLFSLPEFNGHAGTTGGSQGGALAIVTAALDKRVEAVVAFYPALCDVTGYLHGRAGGWPHMFNAKNRAFMDKPEKVKNIAYYDVVNFARILQVPGFYSFGYNDNVCPPTSVYSAVNSIKAPKTILIDPVSAHWRYPETNQKSIKWLKEQLQ